MRDQGISEVIVILLASLQPLVSIYTKSLVLQVVEYLLTNLQKSHR